MAFLYSVNTGIKTDLAVDRFAYGVISTRFAKEDNYERATPKPGPS